MARYKVLKSVTHSMAHSFTSLMNYAEDDYVMGHLLREARETHRATLRVDLLTGVASPSELLSSPIGQAIRQ